MRDLGLNHWSETELAFRCERLSARLERLAENFLNMASLSQEAQNRDAVLELLEQSKAFLELAAIDLDVDSAFELAQMQRQLSRWHLHWAETWTNDESRLAIAQVIQPWVNRVREMAGILV
jgi:hypothetical protein